jgi:hypothetical protein
LHHIIAVGDLTAIHSSRAHYPSTPIKTDLLFTSITIKSLLLISDWDSNTIGVVKFTKSIRDGATALHFVGFAEESFIAFANVTDADNAVVFVYLAIKFKVHTYNKDKSSIIIAKYT